MKRSKETITNRRIMHRYQQRYRLWKPIIMGMPILRINTDVVEKFDEKEWLRLCRQSVLYVDTDKPTAMCECVGMTKAIPRNKIEY